MGSPEIVFFIVCSGFVSFFILLFGTLLLMRWFRHRERLAMIEQGMISADAAKPRNGRATLAWGIGITAFGLAVLCGLAPLIFSRGIGSSRSIASAGPFLLPGLIVLFMGVALIIIHFVTRPAPADESLEETLMPAELDEPSALSALELDEEEEAQEE